MRDDIPPTACPSLGGVRKVLGWAHRWSVASPRPSSATPRAHAACGSTAPAARRCWARSIAPSSHRTQPHNIRRVDPMPPKEAAPGSPGAVTRRHRTVSGLTSGHSSPFSPAAEHGPGWPARAVPGRSVSHRAVRRRSSRPQGGWDGHTVCRGSKAHHRLNRRRSPMPGQRSASQSRAGSNCHRMLASNVCTIVTDGVSVRPVSLVHLVGRVLIPAGPSSVRPHTEGSS